MTIVLTAIIIVLCIYYIWNYLTGKPKNSPPGNEFYFFDLL